MKILPVILAGGIGARLWPLSSETTPKQFSSEISNPTLFHKAIHLVTAPEFLPPVIIASKNHEHLLQEFLKSNPVTAVIFEPSSRNTAPAILACALWVKENIGDEVSMLILPSDHLISNQSQFIQAIQNGVEASKTNIVTFGAKPTNAQTGYGYIEIQEASLKNNHAFTVQKFTEKPSREIAEMLMQNPNVYWNCGIFLFHAEVFTNICKDFIPQTHEIVSNAISNASISGNIVNPSGEFSNAAAESIDYAILQPASISNQAEHNVYLCKMLANWCDVGNFESLHNNSPQNSQNNTIHGNVHAIETRNCFIHNNTDGILTTIGLQNTAIVQTPNTTLILPLERSQEIKKLIENLPQSIQNSNIIQRQWGSYEILAQMPYFKVKKLVVCASKHISLQSHQHRSETWVVIKGQATVLRDASTLILNEGESISIPPHTKHQLINETQKILEIIEVQTGSYLEEDDITRYEI